MDSLEGAKYGDQLTMLGLPLDAIDYTYSQDKVLCIQFGYETHNVVQDAPIIDKAVALLEFLCCYQLLGKLKQRRFSTR